MSYTKSSDFFKNVLTLFTGNSIAQIIAFAIAPILTRLFSPEDFGFFGLFFSIVSGIVVIISARYELAIVLPKDDEKALNLVFLSCLICMAISVFSFIVIIIILFIKPEYSKWFLLIPLFTLIIGIYQILINWNNRKKKYNRIALNRISNSITVNVSTLIFGFLKFNFIGLIIGNLLGQLISLYILLKEEFYLFIVFIKQLQFKSLISIAKEYKSMPKTNTLQALTDLFQTNGFLYLIPIFFNSMVLGLYSLCIRIMQAPINLIGASIAQVFYQKAAEKNNSEGSLKELVKATIFKSGLLALPIPLILIPFGPTLFSFVFGEKWIIAGEFARYLAPFIYFDFIRLTVSQLPIILEKQKRMFLLSLIGNVILLFSVLYAGFILGSLKNGIIIYSFASSLLMIIIILWIYKISDSNQFNAVTTRK